MSKVETLVQQYLRAQKSLDSKYGPYANIAERDDIPTEDRYPLMPVGVLDSDGFGTQTIYYLNGGITNSDWEILGSGAAGQVAKAFSWTWADGVDFGGTHLDFIIAGATESGRNNV